MDVYIQLIVAGTDVGPFDLYSDIPAQWTLFESGVSRQSLVDGYTSTLVPDGSTQIKIQSTGNCTNYIIVDITISVTTTTSTSTTAIGGTTTTTTTAVGSTTTTTTCYDNPLYYEIMECYTDDIKYMEMHCLTYEVGELVRFRHVPDDGHQYCGEILAIDQPAGIDVVIHESSAPVTSCADGCYEPPP